MRGSLRRKRVLQARPAQARNKLADASAFLPLTAVVFDILVALGDGDRHGYAILKEIEARGGIALRPGSLYRALGRMLNEGLVEEVATSQAVAGEDERRRYYGLTPLGRRVAAAEAKRLAAAVDAARSKRLLRDTAG